MDEMNSNVIEIDQYFSSDEWAKMGEYEKKRYRNLKENFFLLLKLGNYALFY